MKNQVTRVSGNRFLSEALFFENFEADQEGYFGGEGGIRTHVPVISRQPDFESGPLRPLRYLSAQKNKSKIEFGTLHPFGASDKYFLAAAPRTKSKPAALGWPVCEASEPGGDSAVRS